MLQFFMNHYKTNKYIAFFNKLPAILNLENVDEIEINYPTSHIYCNLKYLYTIINHLIDLFYF